MAMKQINFDDLVTTKKGYIGEHEVDRYLASIGIIPYAPTIGKAHPFDRLCASSDKKRLFIAECKAKASRSYYPDTGINESNYQDYKNILKTYGIDIWLFFVDEHKQSIYGNLLSVLESPKIVNHGGKNIRYPLLQRDYRGKQIIYFPLESMVEVCKISPDVALQLKALSSRNYEYAES